MEYFVGDSADFSWLDNSNVNINTNNNNINNGVHFTVDDLLDFSKEDETMTDAFFDSLPGNSTDSSTLTAVDSCNSSISGGGGDGQFNGDVSCRSFNDTQFSGNELCVPYDDIAELEWLSNFVEQSFSTDEINFIPTKNDAVATDSSSSSVTTPNFPADVSVQGKARSKRSRAAPCDWSSRLLLVSPSNDAPKTGSYKKREPTETPGRKCLHCASEKTPQWRTGPLGPKTLCNACGVRYKSGRLVPEYRPAASPTFVSAKHSNSHRKVMELRRQKEVQPNQMMGHHHQPSVLINGGDEFLINAAHYRHMM